VDPALEARLKQVDEQLKKLNEEERTARNAVNVVKDALHAKGDELGAAKMERSAIAQTVDKLKKDRYLPTPHTSFLRPLGLNVIAPPPRRNRDAVYAAIRDKRKEHQTKIKELQKAEREKKAVLDKEKRIKAKKEQRERALQVQCPLPAPEFKAGFLRMHPHPPLPPVQELTDAFKDELTLCDRLSTFLVNRQSKPKKGTAAVSGEQEEAKKEEAGEGEAVAEEEEEEEEEEERKEEGEEDTEEQQDEAAPAATATTRRRKAFQFTNATHIDFELLSVQPPTSLDEIPAALESIARKKVRGRFAIQGRQAQASHFVFAPPPPKSHDRRSTSGWPPVSWSCERRRKRSTTPSSRRSSRPFPRRPPPTRRRTVRLLPPGPRRPRSKPPRRRRARRIPPRRKRRKRPKKSTLLRRKLRTAPTSRPPPVWPMRVPAGRFDIMTPPSFTNQSIITVNIG
jgi:hypothetical protein